MKALVFSEDADIASQMVTYFSKVMPVDSATTSAKYSELADFGAGTIYHMKGDVQSDSISLKLQEVFNGGYDYLFISSTILGREVAGNVSERLEKEIVPEINSFELKNGKAVTKRFFLGGKTVLDEESDSRVFTVTPGISEPQKTAGKSAITEVELPQSALKTISTEGKSTTGVNLEKAKVIVCVGRGLGKKEGIASVEPLVKAVGGELAGSRPVCLDYQWLTEDRQVGISGKKVRPNLYIALGVSGQIQHIAGMRGSRTVIAINKDKSAPIFEEADYGLVGDLYQIIPKLVKALSS